MRRGMATLSAVAILYISMMATARVTPFFMDNPGVVTPQNPYGYIGDTLNLTCQVTDTSIQGNVSGLMYFTKMMDREERILPMEYVAIVNTRTIRLEYPVTDGQDQGMFTCHLNTTAPEGSTLLGQQYVTVDYRPQRVSSVVCEVYDWSMMTCKWSLGINYVNKDLVSVALVWAIQDGQFDCPHQNVTSCTWKDENNSNAFKPDMPYYMAVIVTTTNQDFVTKKEAKSKTFAIQSANIVKPAPVKDLTVVTSYSRRVSLRWQHHQVNREKMYWVEVWQKDRVVRNMKTDRTHVTVKHLLPATDYVFRVACIPIPIGSTEPQGIWSEWTSKVAKTQEEVPSAAPRVTTGSYSRACSPQSDKCRVIVYWKPVDEEHRNGEILRYRVSEVDMVDMTVRASVLNSTVYQTDLILLEHRDYQVQIQARTKIGYSEVNSTIFIPAQTSDLAPPSHFLVLASDNILDISWQPPAQHRDTTLTGYTLYYCTGFKTTWTCQNELKWVHLGPTERTFQLEEIDVAMESTLVGVSAEKDGPQGLRSSGILWSPCIYNKHIRPGEPKIKFSANQPYNGLSVMWGKLDCSLNPSYITHYVLSICRVSNMGGCAGPTENHTVENTAVTYEVQNLQAGIKYRITLHAVSIAGEGPESQPIVMKVVNNDLNSGQIAGIVFGCLFVLVLVAAVVVFCIRKMRRVRKGFYYHVEYPKLPPLREVESQKDPTSSSSIQDRPLPAPPTTKSQSGTGHDDGYSSDSNPTEPGKYEEVESRSRTTREGPRNVSVSSETSLLNNMEENHQNEDHRNCQPYEVTDIKGDKYLSASSRSGKASDKPEMVSSVATSAPSTSAHNTSARTLMGDNSASSYAQLGQSDQSGSSHASGRSPRIMCNPRLPGNHPQNLHVGFAFSSPPPETAPPPPPQLENDRPSRPCDGSVSYVTNMSDIVRPFLPDTGQEQSQDLGHDYSRIGSDGSSTPSHPDYVDGRFVQENNTDPLLQDTETAPYQTHTDMGMLEDLSVTPNTALLHDHMTPSPNRGYLPHNTLSPTLTSTPQPGQPTVRPLSEYMKYLPHSYYEEPQPDLENGPTTEL